MQIEFRRRNFKLVGVLIFDWSLRDAANGTSARCWLPEQCDCAAQNRRGRTRSLLMACRLSHTFALHKIYTYLLSIVSFACARHHRRRTFQRLTKTTVRFPSDKRNLGNFIQFTFLDISVKKLTSAGNFLVIIKTHKMSCVRNELPFISVMAAIYSAGYTGTDVQRALRLHRETSEFPVGLARIRVNN